MKKLCLCFCLILLTACQSGLKVNKDYQAVGQDSRVQYVVLHYTATNFNRSLYLLTKEPVSSHYLIEDQKGTIYQLVDEKNRAWHAGLSEWQGRTFLNSSSIGIEIVNEGFTEEAHGNIKWHPYSEAQIQSLILLLKDIKARYKLSAENILGHSDIAPLRKTDPGPLFPWRRLAKEGLAVWPNEQAVAAQKAVFDQQKLPDTSWVQEKLAIIGYAVPQTGLLDKPTVKVIKAFQMRYQPENVTGVVDSKTAALLVVVARKDFITPK